jgi:hypothetical protein
VIGNDGGFSAKLGDAALPTRDLALPATLV